MRGGDVFMQSLLNHKVSCIFGNPGTTENSVLDRLIDYPRIKYYTTLHEGVAVGAATFYALATGKTPVVNVHVTPGLGNAIGLIFGALKARAPMVVTAGQQDTRLRAREALFAHDLVAMAAPVTKWAVEPRDADELASVMQRAFQIANEAPCGPVFVSLPVDIMEQETDVQPGNLPSRRQAAPADIKAIEQLVDQLLNAERTAFVVGDEVANADAVETMVRLAERCGAAAFRECLHAQIAFPANHPHFRGHIPFDAANIRGVLSDFDLVVMIGGQFFEEMWFAEGSPIPKSTIAVRIEATKAQLTTGFDLQLALAGDIGATLTALDTRLAERMSIAHRKRADRRHREFVTADKQLRDSVREQARAQPGSSPMPALSALYELGQCLPEDAVIIDESLTTAILNISDNSDAIVGGALYSAHEMIFNLQTRFDFYAGRGGGLGQGMAGAIGLQIACRDRRVVALIGDGSGMYSIQALWSAAHLGLPIVFVIFSNREYRVLKHNLDIYRHRFGLDLQRPYPHMNLSEPGLCYTQIAAGMGVDGTVARNREQLADAISVALSEDRPYLIDVEVAGKV